MHRAISIIDEICPRSENAPPSPPHPHLCPCPRADHRLPRMVRAAPSTNCASFVAQRHIMIPSPTSIQAVSRSESIIPARQTAQNLSGSFFALQNLRIPHPRPAAPEKSHWLALRKFTRVTGKRVPKPPTGRDGSRGSKKYVARSPLYAENHLGPPQPPLARAPNDTTSPTPSAA